MRDNGDNVFLQSEAYNDVDAAGSGTEVANGGNGDDTIYGADGADTIRGQQDDDVIFGEGGDDTIDGGSGDDQVSGGDGQDTLYGGILGQDTLTGGNDADAFILYSDETVSGAANADVITDFQVGVDRLVLENILSNETGTIFDLTFTAGTGDFEGDTIVSETGQDGILVVLRGVSVGSVLSSIGSQLEGTDEGDDLTGTNSITPSRWCR